MLDEILDNILDTVDVTDSISDMDSTTEDVSFEDTVDNSFQPEEGDFITERPILDVFDSDDVFSTDYNVIDSIVDDPIDEGFTDEGMSDSFLGDENSEEFGQESMIDGYDSIDDGNIIEDGTFFDNDTSISGQEELGTFKDETPSEIAFKGTSTKNSLPSNSDSDGYTSKGERYLERLSGSKDKFKIFKKDGTEYALYYKTYIPLTGHSVKIGNIDYKLK